MYLQVLQITKELLGELQHRQPLVLSDINLPQGMPARSDHKQLLFAIKRIEYMIGERTACADDRWIAPLRRFDRATPDGATRVLLPGIWRVVVGLAYDLESIGTFLLLQDRE